MDPLAEKAPDWSPFRYGFNNPISCIDPNGMYEDWVERDGEIIWDEKVTSADDKDLKEDDTYLGKEGYDLESYYHSDGTKTSFSGFMLDDVKVKPNEVEVVKRAVNNAINKDGTAVVLGIADLISKVMIVEAGISLGVKGFVWLAAKQEGKRLAVKTAAKGSMKLWPAASNGRTVINGIEYTTHALERMQPVGTIMKGHKVFSRGIPPSVVENAVKFGQVTRGNTAAEVVKTFENVRVITNPQGTRVISVIKMGH